MIYMCLLMPISANCGQQIVAVVYTLVYQSNLISEVLVTNKSQIPKRNITTWEQVVQAV